MHPEKRPLRFQGTVIAATSKRSALYEYCLRPCALAMRASALFSNHVMQLAPLTVCRRGCFAPTVAQQPYVNGSSDRLCATKLIHLRRKQMPLAALIHADLLVAQPALSVLSFGSCSPQCRNKPLHENPKFRTPGQHLPACWQVR